MIYNSKTVYFSYNGPSCTMCLNPLSEMGFFCIVLFKATLILSPLRFDLLDCKILVEQNGGKNFQGDLRR